MNQVNNYDDKKQSMQQLRQKIIDENICPDLANSASQLVMGEGNLNAKVVFIGEAPGKKEDQLGQPFVGASGKLLNNLLETIDLRRQDVYITNIVKYRPPNNRDPKPAEKIAFFDYLIQQLAIIQPSVIVTLGRHSLNCFLKKAKISDIHGKCQNISLTIDQHQYDYQLISLYHPAAALYNGSMRQTLFDDFQVVAKVLCGSE